jgi:hypothetical protein
MAATEEMNQAVGRDGLRAQGGRSIERVPLAIEEMLQAAKGGVIKSFSSGESR